MASTSGRGPRFAFDPALGWALVGVMAVAIVIGAALILTSPAPVDAPGGSASASGSTSPRAPGAGLEIPGPPEAIADGTWVRIGWRDAADVAPHDGVTVGRLDGVHTAELPIAAPSWGRGYGTPFVRGPAAGMVLVATSDGGRVAFDMLDATTGQTTRAGTVNGDVTDAVLSRDATQLFFLVGDEQGLRAGRLATDGSGAEEEVAVPRPRVARAQGIVLAARPLRHASLVLSPDETALAVSDCLATCEVRIISLVSGDEGLLQGISNVDNVLSWSEGGIGMGTLCIDPRTGRPGQDTCLAPDLETNFGTSVELPEGWRAEMRRAPDAPPMSFALELVAIGPGGVEVVLDAVGAFNGNG